MFLNYLTFLVLQINNPLQNSSVPSKGTPNFKELGVFFHLPSVILIPNFYSYVLVRKRSIIPREG